MQALCLAFVWFAVAAYCFYTAARSDSRRARAGRVLIGFAALLGAAALLVPQDRTGGVHGDMLALITGAAATLALVIGLALALPEVWRRRRGE